MRRLLYALTLFANWSGSLWLYNSAVIRAKTTGVILVYDFLNSPTAILLAVFV